MSTKQQRIAELAKQVPQMGFTSLAHHIDIDWLHEAYRRTRKDGAVGVDGQTATDYAADLEGNLRSLLDRAKSGTYRAPPVRRVHIPKAGSATETRPHRHPDVGGQGASAGGRHAAGADLRAGLLGLLVRLPAGAVGAPGAGELSGSRRWRAVAAGSWRWTSASSSTRWTTPICGSFLQQRVRDGVLLRLIGKWLNAGVLEDGASRTRKPAARRAG